MVALVDLLLHFSIPLPEGGSEVSYLSALNYKLASVRRFSFYIEHELTDWRGFIHLGDGVSEKCRNWEVFFSLGVENNVA